jgi:hypothetical protein
MGDKWWALLEDAVFDDETEGEKLTRKKRKEESECGRG